MRTRNYSDEIAIAANQNIKEKEYWLEKLSGELVKTSFPYDRFDYLNEKTEVIGHPKQVIQYELPVALIKQLEKIGGGIDIKLHMILVAGLVLLLHRYTGQQDILTGAPILKQEVEGDFINRVLVLRTPVHGQMTFKELLLLIRETIIQATAHQNYPIEVLPGLLGLQWEDEAFPLFDVVLLLDSIHDKNYLGKINYHMLFIFKRSAQGFEMQVEYHPLYYSRRMVEQISSHFVNLLNQALANMNGKISDIDMLSPQEKKLLIEEFNATGMDVPLEKTFVQLFEEQVQEHPGKIAVISPGNEQEPNEVQLTYRQLDEKATRLSFTLQRRGVTGNCIVAIMAERCLAMIAGVLAILKTGAAYLPIDPQYPQDRIEYILKDSNSSFLLTQSHLQEKINFSGSLVIIDEPQQPGESLVATPAAGSDDLLYVIYTSGSTGKPKGVMVQHNHFIHLAYAWRKEYRLQEIQVNLLQMASFSFDVFAGDLARTFINSGTMILAPSTAVAPETLYDIITKYRISLFESTPSYILPFMDYVWENQLTLHNLKLLILGSDVCAVKDFSQLIDRFGGRMRIINSYGVTEATIDSCFYEDYKSEKLAFSNHVPIGKPLPNVEFYILDAAGNSLPPGVPGDLYIGGSSIARGYLNNPELTVDRFIKFPKGASRNKGEVSAAKRLRGCPRRGLYRTGDLGRWLADGNIEFIGRIDSQVKVRGYRIELGEIETQLLRHPGVDEAVVLAKTDENGDSYLCGYVVPAAGAEVDAAQLREFLGQTLPEYMVPWFFIIMDKFSLTVNGKVDRKALPDVQAGEEKPYVAPRNGTEQVLSEIWQKVLGVDEERVGIDTDFFDLGGNSLKAIVISSHIHQRFDVKVQLVDIFRIQTIRGLAEMIGGSKADHFDSLEPAPVKEYYPLSPAQASIYFIQQLDPDRTVYNIPNAIPLAGTVDLDRLTAAFQQLIERHDSLRTSFHLVDSEPVQKIHPKRSASINFEIKVESNASGRKPADYIRPFDLSQAPLLRATLIETAPGSHLLLVDIHHIISDAASHRVLVRDFMALYEGKDLPPLVLQYKDFSEWRNSPAEKKRLKKQEKYWLQQFEGTLPVLELPTDFHRPTVQNFAGALYSFTIESTATAALRTIAREHGATMHMLMLAIFFILMAKLGDCEDVIVGTPVSGRTHADLENIIGVFINTLAIRAFPGGSKTFQQFFKEVKIACLEAYENQDYRFEEIVKKIAVQRIPGRNPLFDVLFEIQTANATSNTGTGAENTSEKSNTSTGDDAQPGSAMQISTTKFDLDWVGIDTGEQVKFVTTYSTAIFEEETIVSMGRGYQELVRQVIENKDIKIRDLDYSPGSLKKDESPQTQTRKVEFHF